MGTSLKASPEERLRAIGSVLATRTGALHLMGAGGVGMAGLATLLKHEGFAITGCDVAPGALAPWLQERGVPVADGHDPRHVTSDLAGVVRSAAVDTNHPELREARRLGVPVWRRGHVLAALGRRYRTIAVSGTHGKTTTSALVAHLLKAAGLAPSHCIGGVVPCLGGVAAPGASDLLVLEADESDGTAAHYQTAFAVVTNIEFDHMEHFASEEAFAACFSAFADGAAEQVIYCADDPRARELLAARARTSGYGWAEGAEVRGTEFVGEPLRGSMRVAIAGRDCGRLAVPMPGRHHAQNALGAVAVAHRLGVPFEVMQQALLAFTPPRRRFEVLSRAGGVTVVSDYAHHPTAIKGVVADARALGGGRVVAVFQPHRYTRTLALGAEFPLALAGADIVLLTPVYAASEAPLEGGTSQDLLRHFQAQGMAAAQYADSLDAAWDFLQATLKEGDVLLVVGAGDIETLGVRAQDHFAQRAKGV